MWSYILESIIIGDLLINFFFHIIQLRRYCCQQDALRNLGDRFGSVEHKLNNVERSTKRLHETVSFRERRPQIIEDIRKEEEVD